jgi:hypothetical protein
LTKTALINLGLKEENLFYPNDSELNLYTHDPDLKELARKKLCSLVDKRIQDVFDERQQLLPQKIQSIRPVWHNKNFLKITLTNFNKSNEEK